MGMQYNPPEPLGWGHLPSEPIGYHYYVSDSTYTVKPDAPSSTRALRYLWRQEKRGRSWVSIRSLARDLGITYDQADNYITQFKAERTFPPGTIIIEEVEE